MFLFVFYVASFLSSTFLVKRNELHRIFTPQRKGLGANTIGVGLFDI